MGINLGFSSGCFNFDGSGFGRCRFWGLRACNPSFEREQFGAWYREIFAILFLFFLFFPFYILWRINKNGRKVLCNFQAEMKGQLFSHLSNVSNCSNLEAAIGKYSRFFFYFQNLSFSFSTIWRNDRKVLYNFQAEMKQRAIILPSFELEQFGACYREISAILPTRFGE